MVNGITVVDAPGPSPRELPGGARSKPLSFALDYLRLSIPHPDQPGKVILVPLADVTLVFAAEFGREAAP